MNHDPIDRLRDEPAALHRQNRNLTFPACAALVAFFVPTPAVP
jgi:hypothetical protein